MVTAEWAMRNMFFGKWAFAFELAAELYQRLGRAEEARDTARLALKQPWWTATDLAGCSLFAMLPGLTNRVVHWVARPGAQAA
jgi:hypothetical protein